MQLPPAALLPLHPRRAQFLSLAVEALRTLQARILHGSAFVAGAVGFDKAAEGGCFWFRHDIVILFHSATAAGMVSANGLLIPQLVHSMQYLASQIQTS